MVAPKDSLILVSQHYMNTLHAKKKYARANHMPCLTKDLLKVIMAKSRLRNNFLKIKTDEENRTLYVKQQNYCISLLSKPKA